MPSNLKIEELEQRIAPATLSVSPELPSEAQAEVFPVPPGGATVDGHADAANDANGVTVT
jgi:hypothetical protein